MTKTRSTCVLPLDILHLILGYFAIPPPPHSQPCGLDPSEKATLQSLRLTSYDFNILATPRLFHTLILRVDSSSLSTLVAMSSDRDPQAAQLPVVTQYIKRICINLDCYSKDLAMNKSVFQNFHEFVFDDLLVKEARRYGLRVESYRQMLEDLEASDSSYAERFCNTLSTWESVLTSWDARRPPSFRLRQNGVCQAAYQAVLDQGYSSYCRLFKEQKALCKRMGRNLFLKRLRMALKRMPLVRDFTLCDSSILGGRRFNDPHIVLADPQALVQFLRQGNSWRSYSRHSPKTKIGLTGFLIDLPIALLTASSSLRTLELHVFVQPQQLPLLNRRMGTWKLFEAACSRLERFSFDFSQETNVAEADYRIHRAVASIPYLQLDHFQLEPRAGGNKLFATRFFASALSSPRLRHLHLSSAAVRALTDTRALASIDLSTARAAIAGVRVLRLTNVSVTDAELEEFTSLLSCDLQELHMGPIHLESGTFSNTLNLLRGRIAGRDTVRVHLKDLVACEHMQTTVNESSSTFLRLSTRRAEEYITSEEATGDADNLLETVPWDAGET
ncbi:hypothetical protein K4F52_010164 [Lecanicillium sp. MT-2017a]|nr:hypothetical protein K4F52_010164 [Lecanicillium sp. MT-2017a]